MIAYSISWQKQQPSMLEEVATSSRNQEAAKNGIKHIRKSPKMNHTFRKVISYITTWFSPLMTIKSLGYGYVSYVQNNKIKNKQIGMASICYHLLNLKQLFFEKLSFQ